MYIFSRFLQFTDFSLSLSFFLDSPSHRLFLFLSLSRSHFALFCFSFLWNVYFVFIVPCCITYSWKRSSKLLTIVCRPPRFFSVCYSQWYDEWKSFNASNFRFSKLRFQPLSARKREGERDDFMLTATKINFIDRERERCLVCGDVAAD